MGTTIITILIFVVAFGIVLYLLLKERRERKQQEELLADSIDNEINKIRKENEIYKEGVNHTLSESIRCNNDKLETIKSENHNMLEGAMYAQRNVIMAELEKVNNKVGYIIDDTAVRLETIKTENRTLLEDTVHTRINEIKDELESISGIVSDNQKRYNEQRELLFRLQDRLEEELVGVRTSISQLNSDQQRTDDYVSKNISLLKRATEELYLESKDLREKIKFFTEIEEDSKNLSNTEDAAARDALIQSAIKEINERGLTSSIQSANRKKNESDIALQSTKEGQALKAPDILDDEQSAAFEIINNTDSNLFITGKAGTGKSFLLDLFVQATNKRLIVVAPTGVAALNVHGATIHSTFGWYNLQELEVENITDATIRMWHATRMALKEAETIIIDEISMVRADTLDKIDRILKVITKSPKPFGGKQMVFFGDLFQLPPIAKKQEKEYLNDMYGGVHFFDSNSYKLGDFHFIELTTNHRQKDDKVFFDMLNRVREGKISEDDIELLNDRVIEDETSLMRVTTLYSKRADADYKNKEELSKIEAKEYVYTATIQYNLKQNNSPNIDGSFPIVQELHLKRGALVMMVANDTARRWVNGTIGIVSELSNDAISVMIDGEEWEVPKVEFVEKEITYADGKIVYKDVLSVIQYPMVLAYALTIHKSQGMTYNRIACDLSTCFEAGQAYVALSRCTHLDGLSLIEPISGNTIRADKRVIEFYSEQKSEI